MKKKILLLLLVIAMVLPTFGCGSLKQEPELVNEKAYIIQYKDENGVHTVSVKNGELYSIEAIPQKTGHEFLGLFTADGTQYIDASGLSTWPFLDHQNITLYPQFKAKEYTVVLDYGDANITGIRQAQVSYGSELPELPVFLSIEHQTFQGWFTKPDMGGVKVCDTYGLVPAVSVVTEKNFDLTQDYIYLYAGFDAEICTVKLCFSDDETEVIQVPYGTSLAEVKYSTRKDGKAVLTWSRWKNDTEQSAVFKGKITSDLSLYPVEWAPYIEFESNGGSKIDMLVRKAGEAISFPEPQRENCVFSRWMTADGETYSNYIMPEKAITLYAEWLVKMAFDENGGSEVADLTRVAGSEITLPRPQRKGYLFAGWYTQDGRKYETSVMPQNSIQLTAKYYKYLTTEITVVDDDHYVHPNGTDPIIGSDTSKLIDFSPLYEAGIREIQATVRYTASSAGTTSSDKTTTYLKFYYADEDDFTKLDKEHLILSISKDLLDAEEHSFEYTALVPLKSAKAYCAWCYSGYAYVSNPYYVHFRSIQLEIFYPDLSTLY